MLKPNNKKKSEMIERTMDRLKLGIGDRVDELLKQTGISKKDLAELLQKQLPNIYQILEKENQIMLPELIKLSLALRHNLVMDIALEIHKDIEHLQLDDFKQELGDVDYDKKMERYSEMKRHLDLHRKEMVELNNNWSKSLRKAPRREGLPEWKNMEKKVEFQVERNDDLSDQQSKYNDNHSAGQHKKSFKERFPYLTKVVQI